MRSARARTLHRFAGGLFTAHVVDDSSGEASSVVVSRKASSATLNIASLSCMIAFASWPTALLSKLSALSLVADGLRTRRRAICGAAQAAEHDKAAKYTNV